MNFEKYKVLFSSQDACEFMFTSSGPKGDIKKIVQYTPTIDENIYNLAFGDYLPDGSIDDKVTNDNRDRDKILATVASTVYEFTSFHSDKMVFFAGSTLERTRLYRMALTINLKELSKDFYLHGVTLKNGLYLVESFEKGKTYDGFLIKRKTN